MQLYRLLPSTGHSWATSSIESLRLLRGLKRSAFNQIVVARVELVRLVVFSAVEFSVHVTAAALKIAAAVIQLPLYPLFGGVHPRASLVDAASHLAHSVKLVVATPCATLLGLAHPEWSIGLYQKFSLVKQPQGPFASAINHVRIAVKAVWALPRRNEVLLSIATAATVVSGYFLRANRTHNPYALLPLIGTAIAFGVTGLGLGSACLYLRSKPTTKTKPKVSEVPETQQKIVWNGQSKLHFTSGCLAALGVPLQNNLAKGTEAVLRQMFLQNQSPAKTPWGQELSSTSPSQPMKSSPDTETTQFGSSGVPEVPRDNVAGDESQEEDEMDLFDEFICELERMTDEQQVIARAQILVKLQEHPLLSTDDLSLLDEASKGNQLTHPELGVGVLMDLFRYVSLLSSNQEIDRYVNSFELAWTALNASEGQVQPHPQISPVLRRNFLLEVVKAKLRAIKELPLNPEIYDTVCQRMDILSSLYATADKIKVSGLQGEHKAQCSEIKNQANVLYKQAKQLVYGNLRYFDSVTETCRDRQIELDSDMLTRLSLGQLLISYLWDNTTEETVNSNWVDSETEGRLYQQPEFKKLVFRYLAAVESRKLSTPVLENEIARWWQENRTSHFFNDKADLEALAREIEKLALDAQPSAKAAVRTALRKELGKNPDCAGRFAAEEDSADASPESSEQPAVKLVTPKSPQMSVEDKIERIKLLSAEKVRNGGRLPITFTFKSPESESEEHVAGYLRTFTVKDMVTSVTMINGGHSKSYEVEYCDNIAQG